MIQPLRAVHRRAFVTLTLVLPAILLIGLSARHSRSRKAARAAEVPATAHLMMESSKLWQRHSIQSKFYRRSDRPQEIDLVLQPAEELNEPDLLLYWATNAPQGNVLPGDAQLMGTFRTGRAFLLPLNDNPTGTLVLFSPAHQTVFDTAKVEKLP